MSLIPHCEVCDFAKLTILVYEYGKSFTIDEDKTIEGFVSELNEDKPLIQNEFRLGIIKELSKSSPHGKVHKFYSVKSTDLQAGITLSETHKRISVIFRGSESKYDWYYDLSLFKIKLHDDVYVHGGFYKQLHNEEMFENIKNDLLELLKENPDYSIFITGHSLGAALSTLFGYELSREIKNDVTVVSFASPRVGNPAFRREFDKKTNLTHYRISNDRDIITAAPMINFQHVGTNISLSDNQYEVFYNYSYNTWWKFSLFHCWKVSDHYMDVYYNRLLKHKWDSTNDPSDSDVDVISDDEKIK
jgi:predicted lipase